MVQDISYKPFDDSKPPKGQLQLSIDNGSEFIKNNFRRLVKIQSPKKRLTLLRLALVLFFKEKL
jgi:hypothetical protein